MIPCFRCALYIFLVQFVESAYLYSSNIQFIPCVFTYNTDYVLYSDTSFRYIYRVNRKYVKADIFVPSIYICFKKALEQPSCRRRLLTTCLVASLAHLSL